MPQIFTKVVVKLWIVYYAFLYMISLVTCIYYNNNVWIRIRIIICINFWCKVANGNYTIKSISKVNKWLCAFFPLSYDMFSATICFSHIIVCCMCNNCETCELWYENLNKNLKENFFQPWAHWKCAMSQKAILHNPWGKWKRWKSLAYWHFKNST